MGSRSVKGEALFGASLSEMTEQVQPHEPFLEFGVRDQAAATTFQNQIPFTALFPIGGTGVVSKRDNLNIQRTRQDAWQAALDVMISLKVHSAESTIYPRMSAIGGTNGPWLMCKLIPGKVECR